MAQVDASIPLSYQRPKLATPADVLSLRDLKTQTEARQLELEEKRREQQNLIALRALSAQTGNIDPETGMWSPAGLGNVARIDPRLGQEAAKQRLTTLAQLAQIRQAGTQEQVNQLKLGEERKNLSEEIKSRAVAAYDLALQKNASQEVAERAYREAWLAGVDEMVNTGRAKNAGISDEEIQRARNEIPPVDQARGAVVSLKDIGAQEQREKQLSLREESVKIEKQRADLAKEKADTGTIPAGYRKTPKGDLEPIPGGPADLKRQGAYNQDVATMTNTSAALDRLAAVANQLKAHKGLKGVTGVRGAIPDIPGSSAADARALMTTLKAQVGFNTLQEMRNASKTGGALGQVSERELTYLQNALVALEGAQSYEQMVENLEKIIQFVEESKDRLRGAFNMKYEEGPVTSPLRNQQPVPKGERSAVPGSKRLAEDTPKTVKPMRFKTEAEAEKAFLENKINKKEFEEELTEIYKRERR